MYLMHVIEVREWGEGGALIELRGSSTGTTSRTCARSWTPWWSWEVRRWWISPGWSSSMLATREPTIRSRLYAHHLTFRNPSPQVRASVAACGFEEWFDFGSDPEDASCRRAHVRKSGGRMAS